ncbi:MAG TPA: NAD(P)/FAD-dependent oxidoreductase [Gammaproteobacteria bacterium]|nr:NAD(P)/FAD-dependent oxidoreductase [Gammaproteobacteria bacterium]
MPTGDSLHFDVIILGAGFAGAPLARRLERRLPGRGRIALVSSENYMTFTPLLPEVAGASILPGQVVAPLRQLVRRSRLCMAPVTAIDLARRRLHYDGDGPGTLSCNELVLACGRGAHTRLLPGMAEHAIPFKTVGDALYLRNQVISRLEQAELETDPARRRWLTTFVILGGGFSGVEAAGAIHDFLGRALRYYPKVRRDGCQVGLAHGGERIMPELDAALADYARRKMARRGVAFHLGERGARVDAAGLELESGRRLPAGTVVTTVGATPHRLVADLGLPMTKGRLQTNPDMSVAGMDGLWALGDCAAVPNAHDGATSPPTAQFATRQARQLADNIARRRAGRATRAFAFRPLGQLSSIGHHKAVARVLGLRLSGLPAWLLWRALYLVKLPTLARKIRVGLEWLWQMLFPPDVANLRFTPSAGRDPVRAPTREPERGRAQQDSGERAGPADRARVPSQG